MKINNEMFSVRYKIKIRLDITISLKTGKKTEKTLRVERKAN